MDLVDRNESVLLAGVERAVAGGGVPLLRNAGVTRNLLAERWVDSPLRQGARRLARYIAKERGTLLIVLAAISTGAAVGWSTGQAGLDSAVLAAVLPVIITSIAGGAGAVVLKIMSRRREESTQPSYEDRKVVVVAAVVVITFSIAYVAGASVGRNMKNQAAFATERQIAVDLVTRQYEYLKRCTGQLRRLNAIRQKANANNKDGLALEPLTADQVCIALPDGASSVEGPLVALADKKGFVALSPETERTHYDFLERCSIEQAIVNRSKPGDAKVKIGWVCPALAQP